jgi:hypothetical protein
VKVDYSLEFTMSNPPVVTLDPHKLRASTQLDVRLSTFWEQVVEIELPSLLEQHRAELPHNADVTVDAPEEIRGHANPTDCI